MTRCAWPAGEGTLQELLAQNADLLGSLMPAEGAVVDGRNAPEPPEPGAEPSPLMRWTSDGSMMEELLKTFTCAVNRLPFPLPRALDITLLRDGLLGHLTIQGSIASVLACGAHAGAYRPHLGSWQCQLCIYMAM